MHTTNLHSDQPITTATDDRFGRSQFANRIADVIVRRDDPSSIVIGVNAPWGEGKTSVLNMIKEKLREQDVLILEFNPWRFPDEETLLKNFFLNLASKLEISLETWAEKAGRFIKEKSGLGATTKLIGVDGDEAIAGLSTLFPEAQIEDLKQRIEAKLEENKKRIIVVMDDIDRLDATEIQAVFRLIKLSATFTFTAYILSFDEERVALALAEKYGNDVDAGKSFLEKIVQVSLPLPPASSTALRELTIDGINSALNLACIDTPRDHEERFSEYFEKAFRPRFGSPRLSKRYTNALTFVLPLMKGEVDDLDLIFIEGIKVFYPKLYSAIRENGDLILNFTVGDKFFGKRDEAPGNELNRIIADALSDVPDHERRGIDELVQNLLPGLSSLATLSRPYTTRLEENRIKEKRLSTREYFWRYFSYGVQPHDVSDNEIRNFIDQIGMNEDGFVQAYLESFLQESPNRIDVLINKLRLVEDELDLIRSQKLALGVASVSDKFPAMHPDDRVFSGGVRYQVARLIVHLANSLDEERRSTILKRISRETPDLSFAFDLAEMIRAFGEKIESTDNAWIIVWNGIEREINRIVVTRIAEQGKKTRLEELDFLGAQDLYLFWFFHDTASLSSYVKEQIRKGPEAILSMIAGLLRVNLSPEKEYSWFVQRNFYWIGVLRSVVDLQKIYFSLSMLYPNLDSKTTSTDPGERIAIEFAKGYRQSVAL